jgi:glyoxylase-like metal-dependent hydrolase (beta-lactamase superfamily II)
MHVAPGIYRVEAPLGERRVCVYLLIGDRYIMLVDSGLDSTPREYILPRLKEVAGELRSIDYVLTTHGDFDHMGGNASIREAFPQACFMAHRTDRPWIENLELLLQENYCQFDEDHAVAPNEAIHHWIRTQARGTTIQRELLGGESIQLGRDWWVKIIHTPGHTRGHVSIMDPRSNTIIIADAALSDGLYTRAGEAAFPPTYRWLNDYLKTTRTLSELSPTTLLTSHYQVMRGSEVQTFLQTSFDFTERFGEALLRMLRSAGEPLSALQMAAQLSPGLGSWPSSATSFLLYPLIGHLESLEQAGVVRKSRSSGVLLYRLNDG